MKTLEELQERVYDISRSRGLSHIGSCISVMPILEHIYDTKAPEDMVLMDNGHASLAWYCVLEAYEGRNALELLDKHGIHANRDVENGIYASNGSLGHNIGIAIGMAIANPHLMVHVVTSDGAMSEGSNWEALRIAQSMLPSNLKIYVNANGYTATATITIAWLKHRIQSVGFTVDIWRTYNSIGFDSVGGHYKVMPKV